MPATPKDYRHIDLPGLLLAFPPGSCPPYPDPRDKNTDKKQAQKRSIGTHFLIHFFFFLSLSEFQQPLCDYQNSKKEKCVKNNLTLGSQTCVSELRVKGQSED